MHITLKEMNVFSFQLFRKTAWVRARQLTEDDFQQRKGIIHTLEGPVEFQPGDYLARGIQGEEWPISAEAFGFLYDESTMTPDTQGFASYCPANVIHQAVQIAEPFTVERKRGGFFTGKAGDYLVRTAELEGGRIVDRTIFEQTYERVVDQ